MDSRTWSYGELVAGLTGGDRRALARALTLVENNDPEGARIVRELFPATGRAFVIGVTGPPGAGKSSLISALITLERARGRTVGVLGVDPSSPFTRGALLGDRIRLAEHFLDPGVFIRSMATRGHLGGLAETTLQALLLLDAAGKDVVFVETVGTGQSEVEVTGVADVVLLILAPGAGDTIQALKAGIMEIPDVIAVNKADVAGADATFQDLRSVLALEADPVRRPELLRVSATTGDGIEAVLDTLTERRDALEARGTLAERRRRSLADETIAAAAVRLRRRLERAIREDAEMQTLVEAVERRALDPSSAADALVARFEEALGAPDPR